MTSSDPSVLHKLLLDAMRSAVGGGCCYVAGPITSGYRFYVERSAGAVGRITEENRRRIRQLVVDLRGKLSRPVIDSSLLVVPDWTGGDYGRFYLEVIEEFCTELWFVDGWEFSLGATKEFVRACQLDMVCMDARGNRLTVAAGIELIQQAVGTLTELDITEPRFVKRLSGLRALAPT